MLRKILTLFIFLFTVGCDQRPWNNPYPESEARANIGYTFFSGQPKTLDPARSYSSDETTFIAQIYEPPLQYHYLKRPYTLVPLTAAAMPVVTHLNKQGKVISANSADNEIVFTVYDITIRPGIFYQPHPAFAKNKQGAFLYQNLRPGALKDVKQLQDFKVGGTRELVAEDYVYEIKRIGQPGVNSPILGVMGPKIVGLEDYVQVLKKAMVTHKKSFLDLRQYPLAGAQAIDRYHYRVTLKGNDPQFLYWLSMSFFAPIPWEADAFYAQPGMAEHNITFDWYPVGTGPYVLIENNPNRRMVLQKNPYFHPEFYPTEGDPRDVAAGYLKYAGKRLPFIDKVVFTLEKEYVPRWNKFLQGYYDQSAIGSDSFDQAIQMDTAGNPFLTKELQDKGIYLQTSVTLSIYYLGFNMLDEAVGGTSERARKLRQAISIAVDFDEYINIFLNGRGVPAQGPLPPGIFGYVNGAQGTNPYVYKWRNNQRIRKSIATAKYLMVAAGYPNGIDPKTGESLILNYDVPATSGPEVSALLGWTREQFAKIGIQLNIRSTEYNRFQEKMRLGQSQIFFWGWVADYPDPENFLFLLYGPNGKVEHNGQNASNYQNPKYDMLFNQMKNLPNGVEREKIIQQMLAIVRRDAPWVWGVNPKDFVLNHRWVMPSKPNVIARNTVKYQTIDPLERATLRGQWNHPILWPLLLLLFFGLLISLPVVVRYWQKERKSIKVIEG